MGMQKHRVSVGLALALVGLLSGVSFGASSLATGGSGYSGKLSSNKAFRKQQLACDPASAAATTGAGTSTSALAQGAPRRGSTSVNYDPSIVSLSDVQLGTGYAGSGVVQVSNGETTFLQDIVSFLRKPGGEETGYVQFFYHHGPRSVLPASFPRDELFGPVGEPGRIGNPGGYITYDQDGVKGFDTHALFFTYNPGVSAKTVASYDIYADTGTHGNRPDSLTGFQNGREFTLGPGQLSAAHVSASLVPLPPAAWAGSATLAGMGLLALVRRRFARGR